MSEKIPEELDLDDEELVALRCDEYVQLLRDGEAGSVEEYAAQFPEIQAGILDLLPTILVMEDARGRNLRKRKDGRVQLDPNELPNFVDFEIVREIGRGGMGIVYEAHQVSLDRRVAIKVLPKRLLEEKQISQFGQEASTAAKLHHTNIAPIYGVGEKGGTHFFAMQLLKGQTLEALAKEGKEFSATEVVSIGQQIASALAYAHGQGVFHRDIKPANLILDPNNNVWVTDFGLAISRENQSTEFGNSVSGTLRYMPPESLTESPNETKTIDSAVGDIYSLGITLVELLSGRPAFDASGTLDLVDSIKLGKIAALDEKGQSFPKDLRAVLKKMVETEPSKRYSTAQEVSRDLENVHEGRSVSALPKSLIGDLWRWGKRNSALATVSVLAALLLYAVSMFSTLLYFKSVSSLQTEQEIRMQAEGSAKVASQAIDRIFNQFSNVSTFSNRRLDSEAPRPRVTHETAAMLKELAGFYSKLADKQVGNPEISIKALVAQCHVAEIHERLGEYDSAANAFRGALSQFQQIKSSDSGYRKLSLQTARIHNQLGKVLERSGESDAAVEQHAMAIQRLLELVSDEENRSSLESFELAYAYFLMGHQTRPGMGPNSSPPRSFGGQNRPPRRRRPRERKTNENLESALAILRSLEDEKDEEIRDACQHLSAICLRELAEDRSHRSSPEDAMLQAEAIERLEKLVNKYPVESFYRFELMRTLAEIDVFNLNLNLRQAEEAFLSLEQAITYGEQLIIEQPDIADYRIELVHANFKFGMIAEAWAELVDGEERDVLLKETEQAYRQALYSQTFLAGQRPESLAYKAWVARFCLSLASCETMENRKKNRSRLIERAVTVLFGLPDDYKRKPEIASLIAEAKALSTTTMFE